MNRYLISGAEKKTGADVRLELVAASEAEARQAALSEGLLITECSLVGHSNAPANRMETYLREIALWLRFFGITAAAIAFAIVCRFIMTR